MRFSTSIKADACAALGLELPEPRPDTLSKQVLEPGKGAVVVDARMRIGLHQPTGQ